MRASALLLMRLSAILNRLALHGAILALCVMLAAALYQVVARYIFFSPPAWTEELARFAMIWGGMLGASAAFYSGSDPALFADAVHRRGTLGIVFASLRVLSVAVFALPVLWFSLFGPGLNPLRGFIMRTAGRQAEIMDVSMLWITAAIPLVFALILIHALADLLARLSGIHKPIRAEAEIG